MMPALGRSSWEPGGDTASSPGIFLYTPARRLQSTAPCSSGLKLAMAIISLKKCILGGGGHVAKYSLGARQGWAGPGDPAPLLPPPLAQVRQPSPLPLPSCSAASTWFLP